MIAISLITGVCAGNTIPSFAATLPNSQTSTSSYSAGKVYDVNTYLNVRSGAGKSYSVIGKLSNNQEVTITGENGNWYKINYNGSIGYVSKDYITSANNSNGNLNTITTTTSNQSYLKTLTMNATAYCETGSKTATGVWPTRNSNGVSTVAVDPNVIPLGTKLYIEGYGYAIAADTGGAIKGNKIDLYMNSNSECINFGRQNVTVHIVSYPS